ncbi:hypothetical protein QT987_26495 [Microcoleus sp. SVA1B4]
MPVHKKLIENGATFQYGPSPSPPSVFSRPYKKKDKKKRELPK